MIHPKQASDYANEVISLLQSKGILSNDMGAVLSVAMALLIVNAPTPEDFEAYKQAALVSIQSITSESVQAFRA